MTRHEDSQNETRSVLFVGPLCAEAEDVFRTSCNRSVTVDVVADGREAIHWLTEAANTTTERPRPDLILVEFGFEAPDAETLLQAVASSPRLGGTAVVAVGSEQAGARRGEPTADAHVAAPDSADEYAALAGSIGRFWPE